VKNQGVAFPQTNLRHARVGRVGLAVAIGIAYFLAARLGLVLNSYAALAFFWPAAGIATGALIVLGPVARHQIRSLPSPQTILVCRRDGHSGSLRHTKRRTPLRGPSKSATLAQGASRIRGCSSGCKLSSSNPDVRPIDNADRAEW
jgi:hypothetical protein